MQPADFARLQPHLLYVDLPRGMVLVHAGLPVEHVYFPENSLGSIIAVSDEGHRVEAGIFGRDGMSGLPLILGAGQSPHEYIVQVGDGGHRLSSGALLAAFRDSPALHDLLLRYAHVASVQAGYTAMSNAVHSIDRRLARWLLMCHDRLPGDTLYITHEFLAVMLGVRRPGVTTALHVLEGNLLIRGERGRVTIRDRAGLETFAGDAYGAPEAEYRRLIGPMN